MCWFSAMYWRARAKAFTESKFITNCIGRGTGQFDQVSLEV